MTEFPTNIMILYQPKNLLSKESRNYSIEVVGACFGHTSQQLYIEQCRMLQEYT